MAELGAAFLWADLEITRGAPDEVRKDYASYIAHWLKVLKDDKRASRAQRAADYLQSLQPQPPEPQPGTEPAEQEGATASGALLPRP